MADLVDSILNFDGRVRYCALIDRAGSRIRDKLGNGVVPLDPPEMWEDALRKRAIAAGVFETLFPHYGQTRCIIGIHEKIIVVICPAGKNLLVATMEKTMPYEKIRELHELVENYSRTNP